MADGEIKQLADFFSLLMKIDQREKKRKALIVQLLQIFMLIKT
jgi:hypothetical protein